MRGAHRQQRACYLYAFSGPGDVQELELSTSAPSLTALLAFLRNRRAAHVWPTPPDFDFPRCPCCAREMLPCHMFPLVGWVVPEAKAALPFQHATLGGFYCFCTLHERLPVVRFVPRWQACEHAHSQ